VHPIILNHLFYGHVGFRWGVHASTGLLAGLFVIAELLMNRGCRLKEPGKHYRVAADIPSRSSLRVNDCWARVTNVFVYAAW
jgi:hypothetical protein